MQIKTQDCTTINIAEAASTQTHGIVVGYIYIYMCIYIIAVLERIYSSDYLNSYSNS